MIRDFWKMSRKTDVIARSVSDVAISCGNLIIMFVGEAFRLPRDGEPVPYIPAGDSHGPSGLGMTNR